MPRRFGLSSQVSAADQLQHARHPDVPAQPLPAGQGGRVDASHLGITDGSPITFMVIGDHGGVKNPDPQNAVSNAMQSRMANDPKPAFVYTVGDVVYYNGDGTEYAPQFYEAYAHLTLPIVGIPGNHDGDTTDDPSRQPLDTFMANFCAPQPTLPQGNEEYNRDVQTQPYCDWTLNLKAATVVGIYTNVPPGGYLAQSQVDWLTAELQAAPADKPLIVTCHHPPYSIDQFHGGAQVIGDALDGAASKAGRVPDLVLSGHVHDYQRFTRTMQDGKSLPYIVIGNSGYYNLHLLAADAQPGAELTAGVTFEFGDDRNWGFLELTIDGKRITGAYNAVTSDGQVTPKADAFTIGA